MEHLYPADPIWGIKPVLFHLWGISVSTYTFFILLGIIVAIIIYFYEAKKIKSDSEHSFLIVVGAFVGSTLGAKILELLLNIDRLSSGYDWLNILISGRTIVGGLIGGTLGVWFTKRVLHTKVKRGNLFAPAVAIGVAIGRIGCFFNGCCYGKPSDLPWAVDFGDRIPRHPTQIYESVFMLIMFFVLKFGFDRERILPGFLFKILMISYFIFRFIIEFIRVEKTAFIGLTYFQLISIFVLVYLVFSEKGLILKQTADYGRAIKEKYRQ